jgi:phage shock protein PspC (stress-responsive transcriptional regulator)/nitrogen fixation protein
MKTTVNININKQAFVIDEDAYQKLATYINNIKSRFNNEIEANEVIEDIEARIAELFSKKTTSLSPVVDMSMVDDVIQKLGRPEDIFMEEENENKSTYNTTNNSSRRVNRKLFRNPDDKKVSGLVSGLSLYFGIEDATVTRIIIIAVIVLLMMVTKGSVLFFAGIVYFILSMVIPKATTASEKLQMRGEDVNLNNIKNSVMNEMNKGFTTTSSNTSNNNSLNQVVNIIGKIIIGFLVFKAFVVLFGLIVFLTFGLIAGNVEYAHLIANQFDIILACLGIFFLVATPTIAVIYYGLQWILNNKTDRPYIAWGLISMFLIGITICGFEAVKQSKDWLTNKKVYNEIDISPVLSDNIKIASVGNKNINNDGTHINFGKVEIDGISKIGNEVYLQEVELDIIKGDKLLLSKKINSLGSSEKNALDKIRNIKYNLTTTENSIIFEDYFSFPISDKYRAQKIKLILEVPVGKVIYLDRSTKDFIYDLDNVTNTYDKEMVGHYWLMTEQGLKCMDKEFKIEDGVGEGNGYDDDDDVKLEKEIEKTMDSVGKDLDDAENVKININKEGVSLDIDKKDGTESKVTIKDNKAEGTKIKIEKNGVEEKVINIKKDK